MSDPAKILLSIGGQSRPASGGRTFTRSNPLTGEPATIAAAAGIEDARAAAEAAGAAFAAWSQIGPNPRRALLNKAAAESLIIALDTRRS